MKHVVLRLLSNIEFGCKLGKLNWSNIPWEEIMDDFKKNIFGYVLTPSYYRIHSSDESVQKERAYFNYRIAPIIYKYFPEKAICGTNFFIVDCRTIFHVCLEVPEKDLKKINQVGIEITKELNNIVLWEIW